MSRPWGQVLPDASADDRTPALRQLCSGDQAAVQSLRRQLVTDGSGRRVDAPLELYRRYTRRAWQELAGRRRHTLVFMTRDS